MAADTSQYNIRGTKSSCRHWKRQLKKSTVRFARREGKKLEDAAPRRTRGWVD